MASTPAIHPSADFRLRDATVSRLHWEVALSERRFSLRDLVIGANDVVNPAERYKKDSPLYGMPILDADKSRSIIILKRSLKPGLAGEDNGLFYNQNTMIVFGDAKATITTLVQLLKK